MHSRSLDDPRIRLASQTGPASPWPVSLPVIPDIHTLEIREYQFRKFSKLSWETLRAELKAKAPENQDPDLRTFCQIVRLVKHEMIRLNRLGRGVPTDTLENIVKLFTAKSAHTFVVQSKAGIFPDRPRSQALGLGLIITEHKDIPDLLEIPVALRGAKKICRAIRLFVLPEAKHIGALDYTTSLILKNFNRVAKGRDIYAKVLDGDNLHPEWLHPRRVLPNNGFEPTRHACPEVAAHPDGVTVPLPMSWYRSPARSSEAQKRAAQVKTHFNHLADWLTTRCQAVAPYIPNREALVASVSGIDDNLVLGQAFPHASIFDLRIKGVTPPLAPTFPRLRNVKSLQTPDLNLSLRNGTVDCLYLSGSLSKLASLVPLQDPEQALHLVLERLAGKLKPGGALVICEPAPCDQPNKPVELRLRDNNDKAFGDSQLASTAQQFEDYCSAHQLECQRVPTKDSASFSAYSTTLGIAQAFARKLSQPKSAGSNSPQVALFSAQMVESCADRLGLRQENSSAGHNPWVEKHLLQDCFELLDPASGSPIDLPPTELTFAARKLGAGAPVSIKLLECAAPNANAQIVINTYRPLTGSTAARQVALARPLKQALQIVPYYWDSDGKFKVVHLCGVARPTLNHTRPLDGCRSNKFANLAFQITPSAKLSLTKQVETFLRQQLGLPPSSLKAVNLCSAAIPDPSYIEANSQTVLVNIARPSSLPSTCLNSADMKTRAEIRVSEAVDVLRDTHSGINFCPELERAVYQLLMESGRDLGFWRGARVGLKLQSPAPNQTPASDLFNLAPTSHYQKVRALAPEEPAASDAQPRLETHSLKVINASYSEQDAAGNETQSLTLCQILPGTDPAVSTNSISILPIQAVQQPTGRIDYFVGLTLANYASAQALTGSSTLATLPEYFIPEKIKSPAAGKRHALNVFSEEYGVNVAKSWFLGPKYFKLPGLSPISCYPVLAEVSSVFFGRKQLKWVNLKHLLQHAQDIQSADLLTSLRRTVHAIRG